MSDTAKQPEAKGHHHSYIGHNVEDVPKPAVILDVAKIRRHCSTMLEVCRRLGVGFRAHVKTHKTLEVTRLQLGDSDSEAKLIVSTVAEIEHLLPLLEEYIRSGRGVNILYGIPLPLSQVPRIAKLAQKLGPGSIAFMLDHPSQLPALRRFREITGFAAGAYIKIDTGYHRAGLPPSYLNKNGFISEISSLEEQGHVYLIGLYSHSSLSYQGATPSQAMTSLSSEISGCLTALSSLQNLYTPNNNNNRTLTISVGASPQAIAMQNADSSPGLTPTLRTQLQLLTSSAPKKQVNLELHAGVYSTMDLQQVATNSKATMRSPDQEIALRVLAEVISVYNDNERAQPEALIAVGTLGLGREPCQGYRGWGVVDSLMSMEEGGCGRRIIVARISQEHAILTWEVDEGEDKGVLPPIPLEVGQCVFVYPNHACITGAMYKEYFVVDSEDVGGEGRVCAVWERISGW